MALPDKATLKRLSAIIAVLAIVATSAYPPWKITYVIRAEQPPADATAPSTQLIVIAMGNDWLLGRKAVPRDSALQNQTRGGSAPLSGVRGLGWSVDFGRLVIEWVLIAAVYGAFRLVVSDRS